MLEIRKIETGYGKKQVLFGPSLELRRDEIVGVIGPNGAGKSTILKAVCGLIPVWKGKVLFGGTLINGSSPAENMSRGMTFCPQGNRVFDELSVIENLQIGGIDLRARELNERINEVLQLFPILKDRLRQNAGKLSGGEQQMLALARALISRPKVLMLDEPSLGLSPNLVKTVFKKISEINCEKGVAFLIVEQKVRVVLEICHKVYSIKLGKVAFTGAPEELKENRDKLKQLFL